MQEAQFKANQVLTRRQAQAKRINSLLLIVTTFVKDIYNFIPETNHVSRVHKWCSYSVVTIYGRCDLFHDKRSVALHYYYYYYYYYYYSTLRIFSKIIYLKQTMFLRYRMLQICSRYAIVVCNAIGHYKITYYYKQQKVCTDRQSHLNSLLVFTACYAFRLLKKLSSNNL